MTPSNSSADNGASTSDACAYHTVSDCLKQGSNQLRSLHCCKASPAANPADSSDELAICRLESGILLAHVLGKSHSWLYTWPEHNVSAGEFDTFSQLLAERCSGKPVAYLTGAQEFWSMSFRVTPAVLIPRADTELLVEIAIGFLKNRLNQQQVLGHNARVLELGTGSGAIAIAIAAEIAGAEITATDNSVAALAIAKDNAKRLLQERASQINFLQSDWFKDVASTDLTAPAVTSTADKPGASAGSGVTGYQLIISNPPYIAPDDPHLFAASSGITFEPRAALVADANGLQALQTIVTGAMPLLGKQGMLALEHGHGQAAAVRQLLQHAGYLSVESHTDLAGVERVTLGHHSGVNL